MATLETRYSIRWRTQYGWQRTAFYPNLATAEIMAWKMRSEMGREVEIVPHAVETNA